MTLYEETLDLMKNRPVWLKNSVISTDIGLSKEWLRLFEKGRIENPGVITVQKLNDYLKGKQNERK